ncbi:hypothetical protein bthur0013_33040 [Bacillus thuringiensis IBL 200]|nr:hypothetical protein bthur0013_33040 [Bacillus thuringiensis IBL 200]
MLKQTFHSLALLYPDVLLEGWKIEKFQNVMKVKSGKVFGFKLLL